MAQEAATIPPSSTAANFQIFNLFLKLILSDKHNSQMLLNIHILLTESERFAFTMVGPGLSGVMIDGM